MLAGKTPSNLGNLGARIGGISIEKIFSKRMPVTTENLAINFDPFGMLSLTW
jgi:hypothetical protein